MALPTKTFRPGEIVPWTGQVRQVGYLTESTVVARERFPPTRPPGGRWVYTDLTRHTTRR